MLLMDINVYLMLSLNVVFTNMLLKKNVFSFFVLSAKQEKIVRDNGIKKQNVL